MSDSEAAAPEDTTERRIAIFVPCWKESEVIEGMIRHNLARIRYRNFDFFLGVYPNDHATAEKALDIAACFTNVHVCFCADPGPTSKADCLNAIYRGMCNFEYKAGARFDTIVLHDAEDVMHADELAVINRERAQHAMVQVPVLPLPTPATELTHGIYCDEFAEFQSIDMRARQYSGAFVPSNGVGTGFARDVLEGLAAQRNGLIFDPSSLTEDYEVGVQIHLAGFRQVFFPLQRGAKGFIATREFFPRTMGSAIRQRKRWIMGIALQSTERNGWKGCWRTKYWFWRDRKSLLTNPLSLLTNFIFIAGVVDLCISLCQHRPWAFAVSNPVVVKLCFVTTCLQVFRLSLRSICVARIFGFAMGLTVCVRYFHANFVNCAATTGALVTYVRSRLWREKLRWDKTEHSYPVRVAEDPQRLELEEVLVSCGYVSEARLTVARAYMPRSASLPDFLLENALVTEENLCRALSLQSGLPWSEIDVSKVKWEVVRSLPMRVERDFKVLPFRVSSGRLHVAAARVPQPQVFQELSKFTTLTIQFELVTNSQYDRLRSLL